MLSVDPLIRNLIQCASLQDAARVLARDLLEWRPSSSSSCEELPNTTTSSSSSARRRRCSATSALVLFNFNHVNSEPFFGSLAHWHTPSTEAKEEYEKKEILCLHYLASRLLRRYGIAYKTDLLPDSASSTPQLQLQEASSENSGSYYLLPEVRQVGRLLTMVLPLERNAICRIELTYTSEDVDIRADRDFLASIAELVQTLLGRIVRVASADLIHRERQSFYDAIRHLYTLPAGGKILDAVLQLTKNSFLAESVHLFVVKENIGGKSVLIGEEDGTERAIDESSIVGQVALSKEVRNIQDVDEHSAVAASSANAQFMMVVPILDTFNNLHGVLEAINRKHPSKYLRDEKKYEVERENTCLTFTPYNSQGEKEVWPFTEEDEEALKATCLHAGAAMSQKKSSAEASRQLKINDCVLALLKTITSEGTVSEILEHVAEGALEITNCKGLCLYLIDRSKRRLYPAVYKNMEPLRLPLDKSLAGKAATTGETMETFDAQGEERLHEREDRGLNSRVQHALCVPIALPSQNNRTIAVLQVLDKHDDEALSWSDRQALELFCFEAGAALKKLSVDMVFAKMEEAHELNQGNRSSASLGKSIENVAVGASAADDSLSFLEQYADDSVLKKLRKQFRADLFSSTRSSSENSRNNTEDSANAGNSQGGNSLPLISFESDELTNFSTRTENETITSWEFNVLELDPEDLRELSRKIFTYWDLPKRFHIPEKKLASFIASSQSHYRSNPFHNFNHAVAVMHSSFLIVWKSAAIRILNHLDVFSMLIAALCHDIDHPGHSQAFEVNMESELALRYSDTAVLESHHAYLTFQILKSEPTNILNSLPHENYRYCRKVILRCILGTDMAKHFTLIRNLTERISQDSRANTISSASLQHSWNKLDQQKQDLTDANEAPCTTFERDSEADRIDLMELTVHSADLSGQATPWHMAKLWGDKVIEEFKEEARKHERNGLSAPHFMANINSDYDACKLQTSFIENICLPLWEPMNDALGGLDEPVENLRKNHERYEEEALRCEQ